MTFVYAAKKSDCIYLFSDTFWEIEAFGEGKPSQWSHAPLAKIIVLPNKQVVSFAGNSEIAKAAFDAIFGIKTDDASHSLMQFTANDEVEFLLADQRNWTLSKIKNGKKLDVEVAYVGSLKGFKEFREIRDDNQKDSNDGILTTQLSLFPTLENVSAESSKAFIEDFDAFYECLIASKGKEYGGIAVPFLVTREKKNYWSYLKNYRGPVIQDEIAPTNPSGWNALSLNDTNYGGYQLIVGGGAESFAAFFTNGNFGFTYEGYSKDKFEFVCHTKVNPYDFSDFAEQIGCSLPASTWRSFPNDCLQIRRLLGLGELARAKKLFDSLVQMTTQKIASKNKEKNILLSDGILKNLKANSPLIINLEIVIEIDSILELNLLLCRQFKDQLTFDRARHEHESWRRLISEGKFEFSIT